MSPAVNISLRISSPRRSTVPNMSNLPPPRSKINTFRLPHTFQVLVQTIRQGSRHRLIDYIRIAFRLWFPCLWSSVSVSRWSTPVSWSLRPLRFVPSMKRPSPSFRQHRRTDFLRYEQDCKNKTVFKKIKYFKCLIYVYTIFFCFKRFFNVFKTVI